MAFHRLLQDAEGRVFLIHCTTDQGALQTALLVVDGFITDDWITVNEPGGPSYRVQLPAEVIAQPERYKGYACTLPLQRIA